MTDTIQFKEFVKLMQTENYKGQVLGELLDKLLQRETNSFVDTVMVGSGYMKGCFPDAFWEPLKHKTLDEVRATLQASDYDIALKLDSFVLEALSKAFPTMKLKEKTEGGVYGTGRFLQTVYTIPVRDLVAADFMSFTDVGKNTYAPSKVDRRVIHEEAFLNQNVELLFVSSLHKVRALWHRMPSDLFAKYFWKKSPGFIGEDSLRRTFEMLEALVEWGPVTKRPMIKVSMHDIQDGGGAGNAFPVAWGVEPAPQPVDLVWFDEANMAAGVAA